MKQQGLATIVVSIQARVKANAASLAERFLDIGGHYAQLCRRNAYSCILDIRDQRRPFVLEHLETTEWTRALWNAP